MCCAMLQFLPMISRNLIQLIEVVMRLKFYALIILCYTGWYCLLINNITVSLKEVRE